uniref:C2H2-type domain-containing protein n=1 Tax=Pithovirus LCDPAC02 TaxID=2506601 RepID=A0A481YPT5_9VIRU|nr:MAG: hypothetical protein LCDPAC02_01460 [Pithovirus LCDPAC02]
MNFICSNIKDSKLIISWNEIKEENISINNLYTLLSLDLEIIDILVKSVLFELIIEFELTDIEIKDNDVEIIINNVKKVQKLFHKRLLIKYSEIKLEKEKPVLKTIRISTIKNNNYNYFKLYKPEECETFWNIPDIETLFETEEYENFCNRVISYDSKSELYSFDKSSFINKIDAEGAAFVYILNKFNPVRYRDIRKFKDRYKSIYCAIYKCDETFRNKKYCLEHINNKHCLYKYYKLLFKYFESYNIMEGKYNFIKCSCGKEEISVNNFIRHLYRHNYFNVDKCLSESSSYLGYESNIADESSDLEYE